MWGRFVDLFRRRRLDADLESQLAHHLSALEAEYRARGLAPGDARAAARRDMGGLSQVRDAYRDQHGVPVFETIWRNSRFAVRALRRTPGLTATIVLTLALGIGANSAVFSAIDTVLLRPLSFPDADELVRVIQTQDGARIRAASPALVPGRRAGGAVGHAAGQRRTPSPQLRQAVACGSGFRLQARADISRERQLRGGQELRSLQRPESFSLVSRQDHRPVD